MNNVILIGFRGSGKSTIADLVAMGANLSVFHMDAEIIKRVGCPIPDYVERVGWDAFWQVESVVAHEAAILCDVVIDTGGGAIRHETQMNALKKTGVVFWLTATPETVRERLKTETHRQSVTGRKSFLDEVDEVLQARTPLYEKYADHTIPTDGRSPSAIAHDVLSIICECESMT